MAGTTHRKDIGYSEFFVLHRFRTARQAITCEGIVDLGERMVPYPTWGRGKNNVYVFHSLKGYRKEVIWFPVGDFRRLCRYANLSPGKVLHTLYRLSMLAVLENDGETSFKCQFSAEGGNQWNVPAGTFGYLIEKRRLIHKFTRNTHEHELAVSR